MAAERDTLELESEAAEFLWALEHEAAERAESDRTQFAIANTLEAQLSAEVRAIPQQGAKLRADSADGRMQGYAYALEQLMQQR
jgi:hypothetical protein